MGNDGIESSSYGSGIRKRPIGNRIFSNPSVNHRSAVSGTASSDGSTRSTLPSHSGPPLATSFLSSLASTPPVSIAPPAPPPPVVPASSSHYTRAELSNAHFVHSLALLEHVVCSKQARQLLFPLNITQDKQGMSRSDGKDPKRMILFPVMVKDILRAFIQIMLGDHSGSKGFDLLRSVVMDERCFRIALVFMLPIVETNLSRIAYLCTIDVQ